MDTDRISRMRPASYLLPDPGGEVVRELLDELQRLTAENERLKANIENITGNKWSEFELAIAEREGHKIWCGIHGIESLDALLTERDRLRWVIEAAPHTRNCEWIVYNFSRPCDCWKSKACPPTTPEHED